MNKIWNLILKNFWYKLASFIIALLIWVMVQAEEEIEINIRMKVIFEHDQNVLVKGGPVRFVDGTLVGSRMLVSSYANKVLEARVPIPKEERGDVKILIDHIHIKNLNPKIKLNLRVPYLSIFVDEKASRIIPIKEVLQGTPPEGYIVEKITLNPDRVSITGLKSDILKIKEITTEAVDVSSFDKDTKLEVNIANYDLDPSQTLSTYTIKMFIKIGESKINKRFEDIPIKIIGTKYIVDTKPQYISVVLQGTPSVLNKIQIEDINSYLELSEFLPGTYDLGVIVKIPPNTALIEVFPDKVSVNISKQRRILHYE